MKSNSPSTDTSPGVRTATSMAVAEAAEAKLSMSAGRASWASAPGPTPAAARDTAAPVNAARLINRRHLPPNITTDGTTELTPMSQRAGYGCRHGDRSDVGG